MNITLTGNPKTMTVGTGAVEALPAAVGAPTREVPKSEVPNLTVTETPAHAGIGGIPLGSIDIRHDLERSTARKADERRAEEVAPEQLRARLTGGLLPGEKELVKDELDRVMIRA